MDLTGWDRLAGKMEPIQTNSGVVPFSKGSRLSSAAVSSPFDDEADDPLAGVSLLPVPETFKQVLLSWKLDYLNFMNW